MVYTALFAHARLRRYVCTQSTPRRRRLMGTRNIVSNGERNLSDKKMMCLEADPIRQKERLLLNQVRVCRGGEAGAEVAVQTRYGVGEAGDGAPGDPNKTTSSWSGHWLTSCSRPFCTSFDQAQRYLSSCTPNRPLRLVKWIALTEPPWCPLSCGTSTGWGVRRGRWEVCVGGGGGGWSCTSASLVWLCVAPAPVKPPKPEPLAWQISQVHGNRSCCFGGCLE